jgi:hypothetical protein
MNVDAAEIAAAVRSPLSPLSAGELMPGGREGAAPGTQLPVTGNGGT